MPLLLDIIDGCPDVKSQDEDALKVKEQIFSTHPFAREITEKTIEPEKLSIPELEKAIETAVYLNEDTNALVEEFVWKLGGDEKEFRKYFEVVKLNVAELNSHYQTFMKLLKTFGFVPSILVRVKSSEKTENVLLYNELKLRYDGLFFPERVHYRYFLKTTITQIVLARCLCAFHGNSRLLTYFMKYQKCGYTANISVCAAYSGHLDILKYLRSLECPWNDQTCKYAAYNGHLDCLQYLHENGCKWSRETCTNAAFNGHLECLKYAHEHGCGWYIWIGAYAAQNGHLECLKYLYENGCEWGVWVCRYAALGGQLECLKYAHEHGCAWNMSTCINASGRGNLACLKYAYENGCEWDYHTCSEAARGGYLECLRYAHEHGCEWNTDVCFFAASRGHLECLTYARENGCPGGFVCKIIYRIINFFRFSKS